MATSEGWPGTAGLEVNDYVETGAVVTEEPLFCQFPDGNATIARLLARSLVPGVEPGSSLDDVVAARFDYSALDSGDSPVRIRLDSTAVNVRHRGDPKSADEVEVTYVRGDRAYRVRGRRSWRSRPSSRPEIRSLAALGKATAPALAPYLHPCRQLLLHCATSVHPWTYPPAGSSILSGGAVVR